MFFSLRCAFLYFCLCFSLFGQGPHILYINADDLGYSDLGCYGGTFYETPNIDALAASGARFTNGYAAAANCAPSRACAMSGQWPQRHGVYTVNSSERGKSADRKLIPTKNTKHVPSSNLLLPQFLQDSGYKTAHFGKWHVTEDPLKSGFQVNYGGFGGGSPSHGGYHAPYKYPGLKSKSKDGYLTDRLAEEGANYIKEHADGDSPLFIHFTTYSVHAPIQPRKDLLKHYEQKEKSEIHDSPSYAAMVHALDEAVGKLVTALDEAGIREKTLIIFTSDNGGVDKYTDNFPLRGEKGSYYEGGIREPFIWNWKGKIQTRTDDTPITQLDLYPTLAHLAERPLPPNKLFDGENLLPLLLEKTPLKERSLYWHFPIYLQSYGANDEIRDPLFRTRPGSVIRKGDWKLHEYFENNEVELYNLSQDVGEKENLALKNSDKVAELHALLKDWQTSTEAPVPTELNPKYVQE